MESLMIVVAIWIILGAFSSSRKKADAEKKRAARRAEQQEDFEEIILEEMPQEAPKKQMTLAEFREQYEREQARAEEKRAEEVRRAAMTRERTERKIVQPTVQTKGARVQPTLETKTANVRPTVAPPSQPVPKARHEERCAVDVKAKKPVIVATEAKPIKTGAGRGINKPVDLPTMMQRRGYTPAQQGLIWAEVFGEPKSVALRKKHAR